MAVRSGEASARSFSSPPTCLRPAIARLSLGEADRAGRPRFPAVNLVARTQSPITPLNHPYAMIAQRFAVNYILWSRTVLVMSRGVVFTFWAVPRGGRRCGAVVWMGSRRFLWVLVCKESFFDIEYFD